MKEEFTRHQIRDVHWQVHSLMKRDYLDVRIEIVDHILNHIEHQRTIDPQYQFYSALNHAFDAMGGKKGIRQLAFNRKYELWKTYLMDHFKMFRDMFRLPQVLFSIAAIHFLYVIIDFESVSPWVFLCLCSVTGLAEMIDRWGDRGWVDDFGTSITSYLIYARSAFVTNAPLLLLMPVDFVQGYEGLSHVLASFGLYLYIVFFIFRFYYVRRGIRAEIMRYRK